MPISAQEKSNSTVSGHKTSKVRFVTIAFSLTGMVLSGTCMWLFENNRVHDSRQAVLNITSQVSFEIMEHLNRSLSATYALAAVVRQGNGEVANYQELAKEMLLLYPGVGCLQLAPGGIVTKIFPLEGNEKAIGHNLIEDTLRNKEARLAIRTRALTLAGPLELVQGGKAVIGRLPIYLSDRYGQQQFWGFSIALIPIPLFIQNVGINMITSADCNYQLSRIHPDSGKKVVFSSAGGPLKEPIFQKIPVPNGEWTLAVEPANGWNSTGITLAELLAVLLSSTLLALVGRWLARRPIILQRVVDERTRELSEANLALQTEVRDRKLAQEALLASEHKLRSICTSLTDLILILDADGNFVEIAATTSDLLHRPAEDLLGKNVREIFPCEQADLFLTTIDRSLSSKDVVSVEYSQTVGAQTLWFSGNVSPLAPGLVVWSARDITQRKKSESERLKLEQQLLHSQKLESLGVLAGGIAHDFNNILMAIIGNTDLALMRINPESPAVQNLSQIERAAARAADLTKQMLAYSGRGKFMVESVDLNHLVKDMLHLLEASISKMALLRLNFGLHLPTVEVDTTQMHQIIMNLIINASEAIGDQSGVITLTTGTVECDQRYQENLLLNEHIQAGLYVFLEITDTGCGMDQETTDKIFDPFFTTKFTGRGLGMAAVIGIVRGHKGAIRVSSQLGKGSSFQVLLPASSKPAKSIDLGSCHDAWQGAGTVLLVDDEEAVRGIGSEMLRQLGFTPIIARDGRDAIEVFRTTPDIAFVILDLTMPQMDGEQCFRELERLKPDVKVIMSSGYNEQEVTEKVAGRGLVGFIHKPYTLSELRQALMPHTVPSGNHEESR